MRRIRIAVCVVLCFCGLSSILAEPGFVVVAHTGRPPLPAGSAVSYDVLGTPFINTSGQVAFGATLAGPMANATNNSAIFVGSPVATGHACSKRHDCRKRGFGIHAGTDRFRLDWLQRRGPRAVRRR